MKCSTEVIATDASSACVVRVYVCMVCAKEDFCVEINSTSCNCKARIKAAQYTLCEETLSSNANVAE